jgi:hypothetical protein
MISFIKQTRIMSKHIDHPAHRREWPGSILRLSSFTKSLKHDLG